MTPKEKAEELVRKYWHSKGIDIDKSIECALIAVNEIIKVIHTNMEDKYWNKVKKEIEKKYGK